MLQQREAPPEIELDRDDDRVSRRLAAILAADIKGYGALMDDDEETTHRRVRAEMDRVFRRIDQGDGTVFSFSGDGLMAEFPSAVEALRCALAIQADVARRSAELPPERRIEMRVGINAGEVLVQRGHLGGNVVNIAARLEQMASPGSIFLSESVYNQVTDTIPANFVRVGHPHLKNLRDPVVVFSLSQDECLSWAGGETHKRRHARRPVMPNADHRASLAVLPFRTVSEDQEDSYFAEGIVDDIIRILGGLKDLLVISRSSTLGFSRMPVDLRRVRHELDVRYVLHGNVRRIGNRLRIFAELSDAESMRVIWSDRFDGVIADLFELQDRIALQVATAVAPQVRGQELNRIKRIHPETLTAYDLTLQALDLIYRTERDSFFHARELLSQAMTAEPGYGPASAHAAYWHLICIGQGWSLDPPSDAEAAANAARLAIERDPNDALALALFAHTQSYLRKDYITARGLLDRALVANPSCAWAWSLSSLTRGYMGEVDPALRHAQQAVRLSPLGPDAYWHEHALSQAHFLDGNYADASHWGRLSAAHNGAQTSNLRTLIASLVMLGEVGEARRHAQRLMALDPSFRVSRFRMVTPLHGAVLEEFAEALVRSGVPD